MKKIILAVLILVLVAGSAYSWPKADVYGWKDFLFNPKAWKGRKVRLIAFLKKIWKDKKKRFHIEIWMNPDNASLGLQGTEKMRLYVSNYRMFVKRVMKRKKIKFNKPYFFVFRYWRKIHDGEFIGLGKLINIYRFK